MRNITTIITLLFISESLFGQLILPGSEWRYYDLSMAPPSQSGVNWKQSAYDHSSWSTGAAQLGYGDADEITTISSATETAYFRQSFTANDISDYSNLSLQLTYDDGAVVYLNGTEIWRVNMPGGTINYGTFASTNSGDNAMATTTVANTLVNGTNVIAVEIHQRDASSTDISFDFMMNGVPAPGVVVVTRGPYLQRANDNSVVVRWRTNINTPSMLDYGLTPASLTNPISQMTPKTEHILTINSLEVETLYYYQLRNTTDTLVFPADDVYFKTYPEPGSTAPLTAWILGDCGTGNNNARNVRNAYYSYIGSQHTDMMLFLGDNAYTDGTDAEYQNAIFQNMYEQKLKNTIAWSCFGNHDGNSANSNTQTGPYYDIFTFPKNAECGGEASGTEAYYSYDYGNVHFIILDSYETDRSVNGPMHQWCEDDLESTMADWIVVFWHHPAYSKGSHDSDTDTYMKQMRENFLPLLESFGVDLVLAGHSHSYERTFLLNEHYGLASSFNLENHTVGETGSGSGRFPDDEAYYKAPIGPESGDGAVYVVTGSSGKTEAGPLNHPAVYYDAANLGSCVLHINEDTLSLIFLRQTGAIDDHFTLIKDHDCVPGGPCDDLDPCTAQDVWDNNCYCRGVSNLRLVTTNANAGPGSLREAVTLACDGDTIRFTSAVTDTIRLSTEIVVDKDLVIFGLPSQNIVISGQLTTRIFRIMPSTELTLSRATLYRGYHATDGGAILNDGTLKLEFTSFIANMQGGMPKAWTNHNIVLAKQGTNFLRLN